MLDLTVGSAMTLVKISRRPAEQKENEVSKELFSIQAGAQAAGFVPTDKGAHTKKFVKLCEGKSPNRVAAALAPQTVEQNASAVYLLHDIFNPRQYFACLPC